jgi:membrane fusion protein (multidrug efflux system)
MFSSPNHRRIALRRRGASAVSLPNPVNSKQLSAQFWPLFILAVAAVFLLLSAGCSKDGDQQAGHGGPQNAKAHGGPGGRPPQPPVPVAVDDVRSGEIASYYTATATLTAEKEAQILARANGMILSLNCEEGDMARAGRVLLQIDPNEYQLRVTQAEATKARLKDRYERLVGMFDQQLVSAEEFEAAKNEFKAAEAEEELARLNLSYTSVTAPFTGRIVSRLVDVGQTVSGGTLLFALSDFDPLLAVVHVPSKEFKKLKPEQPVQLTLDSTKERLQGRIKLVSPVIDPTSGTIKVTIEIPEYPAQTRPGDFAEVSIVTERHSGSTLVPKIAVFTDRGDQIVYVAADSTAERRVVEVGFEDDESAEILSGVKEGETIVVKGQRSLKHGSPIKVMGENTADDQPEAETQTPSAGKKPKGKGRGRGARG